jgi:hypothetical protein
MVRICCQQNRREDNSSSLTGMEIEPQFLEEINTAVEELGIKKMYEQPEQKKKRIKIFVNTINYFLPLRFSEKKWLICYN